MTTETRETLFRHLILLCKEIAGGEYRDVAGLFELTKGQLYPPVVAELAEAFGMMMVQLEAREYRLNEIIAEMKAVQTELAAAREHLSRENLRLKKTLKETFGPVRILGTSPAIQELLKRVGKIADTPVNVLITGETGTGKELIAKTIHYNSSRSDRPFLALNCTVIPETIFESEMFGIEKGVATGVEKRIGKIEQADGGTIFLDEIGDMPLSSQGKILRVIEERRVERVGGRGSIPVDVRIMAATHRDLKAGIEKGTFREDLYYRLNVINLHVPPPPRPPRGHPPAGQVLLRKGRAPDGQAGGVVFPGGNGKAPHISLAGQCPGIGERGGTGGRPGLWRDHHPRRSFGKPAGLFLFRYKRSEPVPGKKRGTPSHRKDPGHRQWQQNPGRPASWLEPRRSAPQAPALRAFIIGGF